MVIKLRQKKAGIVVMSPKGKIKRVILPGLYGTSGVFHARLIVKPLEEDCDMLELSGTFYVKVEE